MPDAENGVPKWVTTKFDSIDERLHVMELDLRDAIRELTNTRITVGNLLGRILILSTLIGAIVASATTLLFRLIGGK